MALAIGGREAAPLHQLHGFVVSRYFVWQAVPHQFVGLLDPQFGRACTHGSFAQLGRGLVQHLVHIHLLLQQSLAALNPCESAECSHDHQQAEHHAHHALRQTLAMLWGKHHSRHAVCQQRCAAGHASLGTGLEAAVALGQTSRNCTCDAP